MGAIGAVKGRAGETGEDGEVEAAGESGEPGEPGEVDEGAVAEIIEQAVRTGLPRMIARVHVDLLLSDDGRRTAAELTRRLRVSPASVSVAVNYLVENGYVRRERDTGRRRDVYVVDDDALYHSVVLSTRHTLDSARAALAAAESAGPDSAVGQRLAKAGAFLERVSLEMMESADRWRGLLA
ncbi:MarR family transcriptional regulator [Streptomyces varsoviensis]